MSAIRSKLDVPRIALIQRFIPHYRVAAFRLLAERYGWEIFAGRAAKIQSIESEDAERPWIKRSDIVGFRGGKGAFASLKSLGVSGLSHFDVIVSEFSLNISWCYEMALRSSLPRDRPSFLFYTHGVRGFGSRRDLSFKDKCKLSLLSSVDGVICYSEERALILNGLLPNKRIYFANNTLDVRSFQCEVAQTHDVSSSRGLCGIIVNRLVENKNIELAIRAVAAVGRSGKSDVKLKIVGDGPERSALYDLARSLNASVEFYGSVLDPERLACICRDVHFALVPGAAGLFVNQALALELPVVLFDSVEACGHNPEHTYVIDGVTGIRIKGLVSVERLAEQLEAMGDGAAFRKGFKGSIRAFVDDELQLETWAARMHHACEDSYQSGVRRMSKLG